MKRIQVMMMLKKIKGINALIISSLIAKILAAMYRFPYQNLVGDLGFYAYQQVYPVYAIITTLSLTALPNFLSSLLNSSSIDAEDERQFFQVTLILSILSFLLLSAFAVPLSIAMGTAKLSLSLISSSTPLLLVPFLSLYRGVNQSKLDMTSTAISQVIEQTVRVIIIILAALSFTRLTNDVYMVSSLAMIGSFFAGLLALLYLMRKTDIEIKSLFVGMTDVRSKWIILKRFGSSSLVFVFFMIYMLLMQLVDVFTVKDSLVASGIASNQAEILKGIYDRGQPFLQLGLVFVTSILTSALPRLTRDRSKQKEKTIFDLVVYLSITLTVGLSLLLPQMNMVLFKDNVESKALILFVSQVALVGIVQFYHHHLFLQGKNRVSAYILSFGLLTKILLSGLLTRDYLLVGASMSSVISISLVLILYIWVSKKFPNQIFNLRFLVSLGFMIMSILLLNGMFHVEHRLGEMFILIIITLISGGIFIISSRKLKAFSKEVWEEIGFK